MRKLLSIRIPGTPLPLVLLVMAVALLLGGLAILATARFDEAARDNEMLAVAQSSVSAIDEAVRLRLVRGQALSASLSLQRGDVAAFETEAREVAASFGVTVLLIAPGPDYNRLMNTSLPPGRPPRYGGLMLPDEEAPLPRVFATGTSMVTDLGRSPMRGRATALALFPVRRDGVVVQVVAIEMPPSRVMELLQPHVRGRFEITVVDGRGRTIASTRREDLLDRPAPAWMRVATGMPEVGPVADAGGEARVGAVLPMRHAPWTVAVSASAHGTLPERVLPWAMVLAGGVLMLAGGVLGTRRLEG